MEYNRIKLNIINSEHYLWKEVYPQCASLTWELILRHEMLCSCRESYIRLRNYLKPHLPMKVIWLLSHWLLVPSRHLAVVWNINEDCKKQKNTYTRIFQQTFKFGFERKYETCYFYWMDPSSYIGLILQLLPFLDLIVNYSSPILCNPL